MDTKEHEETRRNTKTDRPPATTSGTKIRLQFRALGGTLCPWWITPSIGFRQVEGSGSRTARCDVVKLVSVIDGLAEINGHGGENIRADQFTVHSPLSTIYYLLTTSHIAGPPPCRADRSRNNGRSLMKMNHEWTRRNTKRHEDRWTSYNDKRHQNTSAISCPWWDFVSLVDNPLNWFQTGGGFREQDSTL